MYQILDNYLHTMLLIFAHYGSNYCTALHKQLYLYHVNIMCYSCMWNRQFYQKEEEPDAVGVARIEKP